jgi:proteasome lid subunit RPN8/RPN11
MKKLTELFTEFAEKMLSADQKKFSKIILKRDVVLDIIDFAKTNYPKEFIAVLEGETKAGDLTITGLLYQPYKSSSKAAFMWQNLPMTSSTVGIVHSHPSPNNTPSSQDLRFFGKGGIIHLIIGYPFTEQTLACYDLNGNAIQFSIE